MAKYISQSSPRNTYETPKMFGLIDARILVLILVCILHLRWYTVGPTLLVAALLWYFEVRRAMGLMSAIRMVRQWLAGPIRHARGHERRGRMVDFQRQGVYWRPYRERDWY